jgi:chromosome segregation ATPase
MRLNSTVVLPAVLLALAAFSPCAFADAIKCIDSNGKVYYSDKPSLECGKGATKKLSPSGVERPGEQGELTPEQRKADAEKKKAIEAEKVRVIECQRSIKALTTTYNSPQEIDAAREKNLQQANDTIQGLRQKIADIQQSQIDLQKQMEAYRGKKVPADLKESVNQADKDLRTNQDLVISKRRELDSIRAKFEAEKTLFLDLTSANPSPAATCESKTIK